MSFISNMVLALIWFPKTTLAKCLILLAAMSVISDQVIRVWLLKY